MNGFKFFNLVWAVLGGSALGKLVERKVDLGLALDLSRKFGVNPQGRFLDVCRTMLGEEMVLKGAYPDVGRRWLPATAVTALDLTGANSHLFNCYDYFIVDGIGLVWVTAGTVTAMSMNFNLHPELLGVGTAVANKLDGTNGFITSPAVASQAIKDVLYKDLGATGTVRIVPGQSIKALVATPVTAGTGFPFVLGVPIAESMLNHATYRASL